MAQVEKLAKCINALVAILQDDSENASLLEQIQAEESRLRYAVRDFFANYKKHLLITGEVKKVGVKTILSRFLHWRESIRRLTTPAGRYF